MSVRRRTARTSTDHTKKIINGKLISLYCGESPMKKSKLYYVMKRIEQGKIALPDEYTGFEVMNDLSLKPFWKPYKQ